MIQLISKDKQIESLVEKLCLRFKLSDKPRVWKDLAYCLTLLNYNEKSLLRLKDNFFNYKNCLEDDTVYDLLLSIVSKHRNSTKDEMKVCTIIFLFFVKTFVSFNHTFLSRLLFGP